MPIYYHCTGCGRSKTEPINTTGDGSSLWDATCCTCCHDGNGNHGPGRNDGGGW